MPSEERGSDRGEEVVSLQDKYSNGLISRREFLKKLSVLAGGAAATKSTSLNIRARQARSVRFSQGQKETRSCPARYNKEAAQLAWSRTLLFLNEKLKT